MRSILAAGALPRLITALVLGALPHTAQGVVYPEHRQLSLLAVQRLDAERKAVFDRLWQDARAGDEQRLRAGAVGGSALANDAEQYQADLLRHFPAATCTSGDGGAVNTALLLARHISATVAHFVDSQVRLRQAGADRCSQRQPNDLLRSGRARQHSSRATSTPTTGHSRCRSHAHMP
jgi:hypothetical protein